MLVRDVLTLTSCRDVRPVHPADLERVVEVAHVVDVSEIQRWVIPGTLLLSTGLSWPRDPAALRAFGEALAACNPAAVLLAVPRYFEGFPPGVAGPLAAAGIPAFELPWAVPFVQVVQETHAFILQEQAQELRRSERIHRALTRAALSGNLADVAGTLGEHLHREVLVVGRAGQPLTAAVGDAPTATALRKALHRPGNAARPVGGGLLVPVVLRGQREAGVWVAGPADRDLTVRAAEHAATVAGLLLLAQQDAELREARLGYAFVDTLLEGRFSSDPAVQERSVRLGFDPQRSYRVALLTLVDPLPLSPEGFASRERAAQLLREVLVSLGTAPLVSVSLNTVWFLLPENVNVEMVWSRLGWATRSPAPGGMVYGRVRPGVDGVAQGRAEVLSLAPYARAGELRSYAQVLMPRALRGDRDAQEDLITSLLQPLRRARGGDALVQTMRALTDTGFAQVDAAQRLNVHANTLRYRMERVEALTGRRLADPQTRALWWLALQLADLHGTGELEHSHNQF